MIKDIKDLSSFVVDEYIRLYSIKNQNGFISTLNKYIEKSQLKKGNNERYKTFISRGISDKQKADLLHNNPIFDFIPIDKDARKNVYPIKETWKYWWKTDETDSKIYSVVSDAADFGSGFMYQGWKIEYQELEIPKYDSKTKSIVFEKQLLERYNGIYSEYIRLEDIFLDGISVEDSNICIWRKFWDRKEFINAHKYNNLYKNINDNIKTYDVFLAGNPKLPKLKGIKTEDLLVELRYYNKSEDKLIILANGTLVQDIPNPHLHKEIPIVKYDNHIYRNRLIQMGNYEMLEDVEDYLDKVRLQTIDVTKANMGFNIIEKESDFDPETYKVGVNEFIELENPDAIKHFSANIPVNSLGQLQQLGQEDAIILSGVDFRSQVVQGGETATKTASKNQAQLKTINMILKRNSFNFYNRLAKLRLADLQFIHSIGNIDIPLKGFHVEGENFIKLQDGYGLFTVEPKMVKGKFNIVLQTESLLGDSSEKEKENYLNFFQIFGNLVGDDQKRIINPSRMVEIAGQKIGVDIETLLEKEIANKSGEEMINDIIQEQNGMSSVGNPSNNPNYIPPANRANNAGGVNVIGGGNTNSGLLG